MSNVKNAAIRILVGIGILVTFSACETTKQSKVMSAEEVREQPQVSSDGVIGGGGRRSTDEEMISVEEFGSSDFSPEILPSPTFPKSPKLPEPELPEEESDVVAFEPTPPTRSLPAEPLEFPKGNRSPASDYVPELPPQPEGASQVEVTQAVEAEPVVEPEPAVEALTTADIDTEEPPVQEEVAEVVIKDSKLEHVFFGFDQYSIRDDAVSVLEKNAEMLNDLYKDSDVLIEGHCDERGTTDYNVELGKRRAQAVKDYLIDLGVNESRIRIVSYGKEKPFCRESEPECWKQNRRGHFVLQ